MRRVDAASVACVGLIALGWFGMNSLVASLGALSQATRFYEIWVVLRHPTALIAGSAAHDGEVLCFTLLCLLLLALVLLGSWSVQRSHWLLGLAPLALMLLCFGALYIGGSAAAPAPDESLRGQFAQITNAALHRMQANVARHISLGAGAPLSLIASAVLAVRCLQRYRSAAVNADAPT